MAPLGVDLGQVGIFITIIKVEAACLIRSIGVQRSGCQRACTTSGSGSYVSWFGPRNHHILSRGQGLVTDRAVAASASHGECWMISCAGWGGLGYDKLAHTFAVYPA